MRKFNKILTALCCVSTLFSLMSCNSGNNATPEDPVVNYEVSFNDESIIMITGENKSLSVKAYADAQADDDAQFTWASSNTDVATVANGVVTAMSSGTAYVTVKYENVTDVVTVTVLGKITKENVNSFKEEYINVFGRSYVQDDSLMLDHTANGVEVGIIGTSLKVNLKTNAKSYMRVWVDGVEQTERIEITSGTSEYMVVDNLTPDYHLIRMVKATEMQNAAWQVVSFDSETFATAIEKPDLKIEFIGDSITAGYGVLGAQGEGRTVQNSDPTKSYAYQTAALLNADYSVVAWSGICVKAYRWAKNINMDYLYDLQSFTNREEYSFKWKSDIVVLNLGTNDADYIANVDSSYGTSFSNDYSDFLRLIREKNPNAYIICLYGMMGKNQVVDTGIQTAVTSLADTKIVYNPIEIVANFTGAGAHPDLISQTTWAELLATYIHTLDL